MTSMQDDRSRAPSSHAYIRLYNLLAAYSLLPDDLLLLPLVCVCVCMWVRGEGGGVNGGWVSALVGACTSVHAYFLSGTARKWAQQFHHLRLPQSTLPMASPPLLITTMRPHGGIYKRGEGVSGVTQ